MGNQPSTSKNAASSSNRESGAPREPSATAQHAPSHARGELNPASVNPRRRESIQVQSLSLKGNALPPSSSAVSAAAHPTIVRPHSSRGRAASLASPASSTAVVAHQLRDLTRDKSQSQSQESMGNEQSRQKGHHHAHGRDNTPPKPKQQLPQLEKEEKPAAPSPQTKPVDVPAVPKEESQGSRTEQHLGSVDPADASQEYFIPPSQYSRPPRLPLPIEEEVHTPGSPIISPADVSAAVPLELDPAGVDGVIPRRASVLSSTTAEEDDDLGEEFVGPTNQPTVPTLIEWEGPGERVYVTGTFAGWNRKFRLHRSGPSKKKDVLSAIVNIVPGTHHLKFIVDNDMTTSDKLPTAVDYTNILVNYLEVSLDDVPRPATDAAEEPKKPEPVPVQEAEKPIGVFPPQVLPPTPEILPVNQPVVEPPKPKTPVQAPSRRYHQTIPRYLLDLDAPEDSSRLARAAAATGNLPTPPTLPMFLSKSILNGTTPMKDDSSVLILPNHTVLNHLATSSIKDNILATSATTRYKQKFLTTIMYKPRSDDDGDMH
ncbi:5'-AMP-activated protein kinase beta subunit, interation domain-containing protein [Lophiotrema nucula]|uniref:5'-AMP-activated protein kinase beta subunit, interation domain-containing protein n=1 Tax=Lophiotrema nucula TaxID=690887 RepID=A0A6A5Z628_9PLEO|nr:5'-AMP-activated protein kinase beta subunit, interation domain-containing protein [Lophiotrema nucula]